MFLKMALFHFLWLKNETYISIIHMHTYTPHLIYSFTCLWTLTLLPCLDCCKWCCYKHWIIVLSEYMPRSGIAVSYGSSVFSLVFFFFLRSFESVLRSGCTNLQSYQQYKKVPFLHTFSVFIIFRHFNHGHLDWCLVVPHCNFNLYFSNNWWWWASFHVPVGHLYVFFGEMFT